MPLVFQCGKLIYIFSDFLFQLLVFLRKAVVKCQRCLAGERSGNLCLFALEDKLLLLAVVNDRCGQLRQRIRILQDGNRKVFNLRVVVSGICKHACYLIRKSHHPAEHVYMVYRMIQRAAAALFFPCSAPPKVIIAMTAPPERIHLRMAHRSRYVAVKKHLQVSDSLAETVLRNYRKQLAAFITRFYHGVAFFKRSRHRLFAHNVFSRPQTVDTDRSMDIRRCAHVCKVYIRAVKYVFVIFICITL